MSVLIRIAFLSNKLVKRIYLCGHAIFVNTDRVYQLEINVFSLTPHFMADISC